MGAGGSDAPVRVTVRVNHGGTVVGARALGPPFQVEVARSDTVAAVKARISVRAGPRPPPPPEARPPPRGEARR